MINDHDKVSAAIERHDELADCLTGAFGKIDLAKINFNSALDDFAMCVGGLEPEFKGPKAAYHAMQYRGPGNIRSMKR